MELSFVVTCVIIGVVVSLDVVGLSITRLPDFAFGGRSMPQWSILNGFWHAFLLAFYVFIFDALMLVLRGVIDWVIRIAELFHIEWLVELLKSLGLHLGLLFVFATLFLIWKTYNDKIDDVAVHGDPGGLPFWLRWLLKPVELGLWFFLKIRMAETRKYRDHVQCALVAVDMLALAALMKASGEVDSLSHRLLLIGIVFVSVTAICFGVIAYAKAALGNWGTGDRELESEELDALVFVLVTLRLLEPFLIFYFAMDLIAEAITGVTFPTIGISFAAAILVVGLLRSPMPTESGGYEGRGVMGVIRAVRDGLEIKLAEIRAQKAGTQEEAA